MAEVRTLIATTAAVHVSAAVQRYAVDLSRATRTSPHLMLGASPRAPLQLIRASQALAALRGRAFVLPDDVRDLTGTVLPHRLLLSHSAVAAAADVQAVVEEIVRSVPVPDPARA